MKNLSLLVLLMAAIAFTGCKKDDEEKATKNIVGKWQETISYDKTYLNGKLLEQETETDYDDRDYIDFRSNGTAVDGEGTTYTYSITATKLTLREAGDDDDEVYDIKKLTSTELVVYHETTYENGADKFRYTSELTLKKK